MAMAGQAQLDRFGSAGVAEQSLSWRRVARQAYNALLLGSGVALVFLIPLHLDFNWPTLLAVGLVGFFLVLNERPQEGFQSHVPLTAIQAAAVATVGGWALPLGIITWTAVHFRLLKSGRPLPAFLGGLSGQLGMTTFVVYAMLGVYAAIHSVAHLAPAFSSLIMFLGIVAVGIVGQTLNNALVNAGGAILGESLWFVRYWRAGLVASLWAYLLVGMYTFSGILGAIVFYYVVAHTRMFERIIQAAATRDERDFVVGQFHQMIREFITLLSPEDAQFAGDIRYLALVMGNKIGMPKAELEKLGWAAEFHEIGKCKLSPEIRAGKNLTLSQQSEALRYPMLGGQVLRKASKVIPEEVAYTVEHQCEAFDGSGYPHGMKGERIPVTSRIIAITRDYLGLLTGHAGVGPMTKQDALRTIQSRAGSQYDPALVDLLCHQIA